METGGDRDFLALKYGWNPSIRETMYGIHKEAALRFNSLDLEWIKRVSEMVPEKTCE